MYNTSTVNKINEQPKLLPYDNSNGTLNIKYRYQRDPRNNDRWMDSRTPHNWHGAREKLEENIERHHPYSTYQ